ncbi:MAG TPA: sortase [Candidatus Woesebacteria bacterium]|nr:sortase [Candidatus Woesebacteria bacterium]
MQQNKRLPSWEYIGILLMRTFGNFLIFSSLFVIAKTFYQPVSEEVKYFVNQQTQKEYVVAAPQEAPIVEKKYEQIAPKGALAQALNIKPVEVLVPKDPQYSIVIPKIGANANIIRNINAANETEYLDALQHGVAHAAGTAYPGEGGHIFLFAHSTDYIWNVGTYNAVFYLLYKLEIGDEVNLFYNGTRHVYKVTGKEVVDPSQVEYLTRKTDTEFLTLQTCWPPGTTLKRMLVFAEPVVQE